MVTDNKGSQHIETERLILRRFERTDASNMLKYANLFNEYKHSIPVIYSLLEGQYEGELYVDDATKPKVAVMFTPFDFHYVAGDVSTENVVEIIDEIIFSQYLLKNNLKEAIVFSPNNEWDLILDKVFEEHNGIKDSRKMFCLNKDTFLEVKAQHKPLEDVGREIVYVMERGARTKYPESRIYKDKKCVSFCAGFMIGKGHAEIDIGTDEGYRNKGYAKEAALGLVDELIKNDIEPDWCTWPYREASQKLAISIGFELKDVVPAHIWVEEECGALG